MISPSQKPWVKNKQNMKNLIYFSLLIIFNSCNNDASIENTLNKSYQGFWAATHFYYEFHSDRKFDFKTEGHYGMIDLRGDYSLMNDTINLFFENEKLKFDGIIGTKYILEKDKKCIEELETQISYCLDVETTIQRAIEIEIITNCKQNR